MRVSQTPGSLPCYFPIIPVSVLPHSQPGYSHPKVWWVDFLQASALVHGCHPLATVLCLVLFILLFFCEATSIHTSLSEGLLGAQLHCIRVNVVYVSALAHSTHCQC